MKCRLFAGGCAVHVQPPQPRCRMCNSCCGSPELSHSLLYCPICSLSHPLLPFLPALPVLHLPQPVRCNAVHLSLVYLCPTCRMLSHPRCVNNVWSTLTVRAFVSTFCPSRLTCLRILPTRLFSLAQLAFPSPSSCCEECSQPHTQAIGMTHRKPRRLPNPRDICNKPVVAQRDRPVRNGMGCRTRNWVDAQCTRRRTKLSLPAQAPLL